MGQVSHLARMDGLDAQNEPKPLIHIAAQMRVARGRLMMYGSRNVREILAFIAVDQT